MENKIIISIAIPAYNASNTICETIQSIANQSIWQDNNIELQLLICSDGCNDTSNAAINAVKLYCNKNTTPNFQSTIIQLDDNKGTYVARNTLINLIKGKYILWFDADDIMKNNLLSVCYEHIQFSDAVRFKGTHFKVVDNEKIYEYNYLQRQHLHGQMLIKSKTMNLLGGFMPWCMSADTEMLNRLAEVATITLLPHELTFRRLSEQQLTKIYPPNSEIREFYKTIMIHNMQNNIIYVKPITHSYKVVFQTEN